ncbi:MAG: [NiFe]-hydrogenase assembly chaperone HybE [Sedimenticola sp.]
MTHASDIAGRIERCFNRIHTERMQGLPIVNDELSVQALGFQSWNGHQVGIIITPWLMNLIMMPMSEEEWGDLLLDSKREFDFPSRSVTFVLTEFDGLGRCMSSAIHSPMNGFPDQAGAVSVAERFLQELMDETLQVETDPEDERLQRFLQGEEMRKADGESEQITEETPISEKIQQPVSRRELLRGLFSAGQD